jgi:hypothetical protein
MSTQTLPDIKNYIDQEGLDHSSTKADLWVIASASRLCFFAANKNEKRALGLTVLEFPKQDVFQKGLFELRSLLESLALFQKEFNQAHIVFETKQFTFIPTVLFDGQYQNTLLQSVHTIPKFYEVKAQKVDSINCVNVFAVPSIFNSTLKVLFPQADVQHYATYLGAMAASFNNTNKVIYVNVHADFIDIICVHQQKVAFINTFDAGADTDIIYYMLSVAENQQIHSPVSVFMMGDFSETVSMLSLLKKYVKEVNIYKRNVEHSFPAIFKEFQDHQYFTATSILHCEL